MEMTRRSFVKVLLGAAAAVVVPVSGVLKRVMPARWVEAVRGRTYPGPTSSGGWDEAPGVGPWAG